MNLINSWATWVRQAWQHRRAEVFIVCVYSVSAIAIAYFHEPWRDEMQAWTIARDVGSVWQLWQSGGYEGTPILWHALLYPLAQLHAPVWSMVVLHLVFAVAAVSLYVFRSPFSLLQKALLPFGYFFVYEYAAIPRSYVLTVLCVWLVANAYSQRRTQPWWYCIPIVLLAQTNLFGLIFSIVLFGFDAIERLRRKTMRADWLAVAFVFFSIGFAILTVLPPADLANRLFPWITDFGAEQFILVFAILKQIFIPLQLPSGYYWDIFRHFQLLFFQWGILQVIVFSAYLLRHQKAFVLTTCLIVGASTLVIGKNLQNPRHIGMIFVVGVFGLWIAQATPLGRPKRLVDWYGSIGFSLLLIFQCYATIPAVLSDVRYPFSTGAQTARQIRQLLPADETLVAGYPASYVPAVVTHLGSVDDRMFSPETSGLISYTHWDTTISDNYPLTSVQLISRTEAYASLHGYRYMAVVLALPQADEDAFLAHGYDRAFSTSAGLVENFTVYVKDRGDLPGSDKIR